MSDFFSRIAPWTLAQCGQVSLATPGTSAVLLAAVAAGMNRWVLGFAVGNTTNAAYDALQLETSPGGIQLCRLTPWIPSAAMSFARQLTSETALRISTFGVANLGQDFQYTIIYADTPPNVLSNFVAGQYAG